MSYLFALLANAGRIDDGLFDGLVTRRDGRSALEEAARRANVVNPVLAALAGQSDGGLAQQEILLRAIRGESSPPPITGVLRYPHFLLHLMETEELVPAVQRRGRSIYVLGSALMWHARNWVSIPELHQLAGIFPDDSITSIDQLPIVGGAFRYSRYDYMTAWRVILHRPNFDMSSLPAGAIMARRDPNGLGAYHLAMRSADDLQRGMTTLMARIPNQLSLASITVRTDTFERADIPVNSVDIMVAIMSLSYPLRSARTVEERDRLVRKVLRSLTVNGVIYVEVTALPLLMSVFSNPSEVSRAIQNASHPMVLAIILGRNCANDIPLHMDGNIYRIAYLLPNPSTNPGDRLHLSDHEPYVPSVGVIGIKRIR